MSSCPLYEDNKIVIDYVPECTWQHQVCIRESEESNFVVCPLRIGMLRQLANSQRGGIEQMITKFDERIIDSIKKAERSIDGLHVAFLQTYIDEYFRTNPGNKAY